MEQSGESATTQFPDIPTGSPLASELGKNTTPASVILPPSSPTFSLLKAENPRGTFIILNGCQTQESHTKLITKLHTGLIDKGWNTLLLELPKSGGDYANSIKEGVEYANTQTGTTVALLGHECDSQAILDLATNKTQSNIAAYITLSLNEPAAGKQTYHFNAPLLDIHGSMGSATQTNPAWLKSIEKSGGRRMELPMANADFFEQEDSLIFLISNWLKSQ